MRGINTKAQLAETEAVLQQRLRKAAMEAGVTLVAPETVFLASRHGVRPRCGGRALRGVRPGRLGRGRCGDPFVLAPRRVQRSARARRSAPMPGCVRARSSARRSRSAISSRSRKPTSATGPRSITSAYIGDAGVGAERQYRRRHHHLQLRRRRTSTAPIDRQGRLHRLELGAGRAGDRSARAPISARARSSPKTCPPTRSRWARRPASRLRNGWAQRLREARKARQEDPMAQ